jgi:hypothetical protein
MPSQALARRALLLACAAVVLSAWCAPAAAQSGRRPPPRRPDPPPAAEERPDPSPPREEAPPPTPISVAKDVASINLPHAVASYVVDECLGRMRQVKRFSATAIRDLRRGEATDLAKSNYQTYVLWLEFSIDALDEERAGMGTANLRNLVVRYVLYAPGSGDVTTQGRLNFTAYGARISNGRVLAPYGGRGRGAGYTMEEAGQKIAEAVMDALGVPAVPTLPRR